MLSVFLLAFIAAELRLPAYNNVDVRTSNKRVRFTRVPANVQCQRPDSGESAKRD